MKRTRASASNTHGRTHQSRLNREQTHEICPSHQSDKSRLRDKDRCCANRTALPPVADRDHAIRTCDRNDAVDEDQRDACVHGEKSGP
eukprot:scaffold1715_cov334-Pavlova_lutheri.AAC.2